MGRLPPRSSGRSAFRAGGEGFQPGGSRPAPARAAAGLDPAEQDGAEPGGADGQARVVLAEFGRPHGLAGEVRLKSYTGDPLAVRSYGPLQASDGRVLTLTSARPVSGAAPDMLVVRVDGVRSREEAERLTRLTVSVPRDRLAPAEADEFYLADLVGLRAEGPDGLVGEVVAVPDYGGGELLEIRVGPGARTALLPFTEAFVPEIDVAAGRLAIAPPAGWLDDRPAPGEAGRS